MKKTRRIQLAWMIFTPVPLASQMTACCHPSWLWVFFFFGWELTSAQQLEHQARLEEVEDVHPPASPQAHSCSLSTRAEPGT